MLWSQSKYNILYKVSFADLYLSDFTDWMSPKSILDVIVVVHAEIGEAQHGNQSHKELLQNNVFFYNAKYIPQKSEAGSSNLKMLPLPSFDSPDWPLPDMVTTEAFRAQMRHGFWSSIKPTVGSRSTHIQWFIPIHVVVDLFLLANWHRTPTLFVFKNLNKQSFKSLMDDGWDTKITVGSDIVKCIVDQTSLVFRYHIGRSILYVNFQYNRLRLLPGSVWENLEEVQVQDDMVKLVCHMVNRQPPLLELEVGSHWTLSSVRQEIIIALGDQENIDKFSIHVLEGGQFQEKV